MNFYTLKIFIENHSLKEIYSKHISNHNNQVNTRFPNAGFDLITPENMIIDSSKFKIDTNIICSMFDSNNNPVSYFLYPRSSISKTNFRLANSVGIIDSGYRGNIIGVFDNISPTTFNEIQKYTKLLQICAPNLGPFIVEIVNSLHELSEETERGSGGFGSTGL
jgi:dUTP pyrophosphatase